MKLGAAWLLVHLLIPHARGLESFSWQKILVDNKKVEVEIADTNSKREQGLMERTELDSNKGMLFIFEDSQPLVFWMKNTRIPLSIAFFDQNRKFINSFEMTTQPRNTPDISLTHYPSRSPAKYALEMHAGWFKKHKLTPGQSQFEFAAGPQKTQP